MVKTMTIEKKIIEILRENTGKSFLDSGDYLGRHWEENQKRNFEEEERVFVEVYTDEKGKPVEIITYRNIYHFLKEHLEYDEECEKLQKEFDETLELYDTYLDAMEDFFKEKFEDTTGLINTYNYDAPISQSLQFIAARGDMDDWILLQVHNGCDIRGGYTHPKVFKVDDLDYFLIEISSIYATCEKCEYEEELEHGYISEDKIDEEKIRKKDGKIVHKCGGIINFI